MRFDGSKTEKVILQQRQVFRNDNNESVIGWENNDREIYAEFWEIHSKEADVGGQFATEQGVRCKIRFINGIHHKEYRIKRGGEIYEILSVVEIPRRKGLILKLKENKNMASGGNTVGGVPGPPGESAYEIWLNDGNVGTEQDFLNSLIGPQGPQGPQGPAGADGAQGPQGPAGANGAQGPQGPAGADGADGAQGPQGPAGADGADGAQGPQGPAGADGAQGPQGPAGANGAQGPQGPVGADGFSVMPVMLECLERAGATIPANQLHDGTHKVAYGSPSVGGSPSWFSISADGKTITLTEDGIYEINHNTFVQTTSGQRSGPTARIALNGVVEGARPATGYIRWSSGHSESSSHITGHLVQRNGTDLEITIILGNESGVNAVNASYPEGSGTLTIKKLT